VRRGPPWKVSPHRNDHMGSVPSRYSRELPTRKRLRDFKARMVTQLATGRGAFKRAVNNVRARWEIDAPAQLPPESEDVLLPPSIGAPPDPIGEYTAYLNVKRRWLSDAG
jgi:hypothetical protein